MVPSRDIQTSNEWQPDAPGSTCLTRGRLLSGTPPDLPASLGTLQHAAGLWDPWSIQEQTPDDRTHGQALTRRTNKCTGQLAKEEFGVSIEEPLNKNGYNLMSNCMKRS